MKSTTAFSIALAITLSFAGCDQAGKHANVPARPDLILESIAGTSSSIEEAIAQVSAQDPVSSETEVVSEQPSKEVIVRAKVGSGKGETFDPATSVFLISDIPEGEHAKDASHDASNCPFCRAREARAPTVVVRLVDQAGNAYPSPADQLLGLEKGAHVVVKGNATYDQELNLFTIETKGVQIVK